MLNVNPYFFYKIIHKIIILCFLCNTAFAEDFVDQFAKLSIPSTNSTPFEKWTYNTALLSSQHCWHDRYAKQPFPKNLNFKPVSSGSWTLPDKEENRLICQSLDKTGINPICTNSNILVENGAKDSLFFNDYLKAYKKDKSFNIKGVLYCYLNSDKIQKQVFTEPITYEWISPPYFQNLNTPGGSKLVNMGNLLISFPSAKDMNHQPYKEPKIVLLFESS